MTLRRRVRVAMVALTALFTIVQGTLAVLAMHEQEDDLVDDLVLAASRHLARGLERSGAEVLGEGRERVLLPEGYEAWWTAADGRTLPDELPPSMRALADGPHLDSAAGGEYHIMVAPAAGGRLFVRYNAARNEAKVRAFAAQVFALGVFFIAMAAWISRYVSGLLVAPLEKVARLLDHWAPASEPGAALPVDEERRVLDAFARVQVRWEQGLARESERFADMHHEIRTPLAALRTDLEMLEGALRRQAEGGAAAAPQAERLRRALAAVDAITGALEAERALHGGRAGAPQRVPLLDCVDDAWASLGELPEARGLSLRNEVDAQAHALVDRQALMAILRNLFRNAAEHAAPAQLRVGYADGRLSVADDGAGIAAEDRAFVFERYYRGRLADSPDSAEAPDAQRAAAPGAGDDYQRGLGLAIARRVAEANGWSLTVEAGQPRGTRFVIALHDAADTAAPPATMS
ncbi:sensor histidine kinase [Piscinibacter sp.]|uniref:sensor histidine kinase n=1 Tax=Piscinibacter sp. TaxID=1903157 RepID=UPI0039E3E5CA